MILIDEKKIKTVYIAGKVASHGVLRNVLLQGNRMQPTTIKNPDIGADVYYAGPYAISCDHGCFHGDGTHGLGSKRVSYTCGGFAEDWMERKGYNEKSARAFHLNTCQEQILFADIFIACIEPDEIPPIQQGDLPDYTSFSCFGTFLEIGVALALHKPIIFILSKNVTPKQETDLWFVLQAGAVIHEIKGAKLQNYIAVASRGN